MKSHRALWASIACLLLFFMAVPATAEVPLQINFQGMLTDATGLSVPDGDYEMTFAIYNAPTGGTALWSEARTVSVANGVYNVVLGQPGNEIDPADMDGDRYLGVRVEGDAEMTPRRPITAVVFALRSALADDADTLDGFDATDFAESDHEHSFSDLTGRATDAQIPDDITINYAASAGNADTLDGMDSSAFGDITGVTAGTGLSGGGTSGTVTVSASFAGTGSATTIARSDHNHDSRYYKESEVNGLISGLQAQIDSLQSTVNNLTNLLAGITRAGDNIYFTGVNVHVRNGQGATATVNQLGNLIVGYDEVRTTGSDKTGSHNIVVGSNHNYSSYGGLVAGYESIVSAPYASVSGGSGNTASGTYASVSGGASNTASGMRSSVSGGNVNTASGNYTSVSGGQSNVVSGMRSSISGGYSNVVSGQRASISGGRENTASGNYTSISGGRYNTASGDYAFVGGGGGADAIDGNEAYSHYSAVLGGKANRTGDGADPANGQQAAVSGGENNIASGTYASVSGGRHNTASGEYAFVGGGGGGTELGNVAYSRYSAILGGSANRTGDGSNPQNGRWATVCGGQHNDAIAESSIVSGGASNTASAYLASVSGGRENTASGDVSSVCGGENNKASGDYAFVGGGGGLYDIDGNIAVANYSAILGGFNNLAGDGVRSWIFDAGRYVCTGGDDHTIGVLATISGGCVNIATGTRASISGGRSNTASGDYSSISGGLGDSVSGDYDWRAGDDFFSDD